MSLIETLLAVEELLISQIKFLVSFCENPPALPNAFFASLAFQEIASSVSSLLGGGEGTGIKYRMVLNPLHPSERKIISIQFPYLITNFFGDFCVISEISIKLVQLDKIKTWFLEIFKFRILTTTLTV